MRPGSAGRRIRVGSGGSNLNAYAQPKRTRRSWGRAAGVAAVLVAALPTLGCSAAHARGGRSGTPVTPVAARAPRLAAQMPGQAPAGQWTYGSVTIRAKAEHGTVGLWLGQGKGPGSSAGIQRYDEAAHRWTQVPHGVDGGSFAAPTTSDRAKTVRVRIMPQDGNVLVTFNATYDDGRRHRYSTPERFIKVVAPAVTATGLRNTGTRLVPGGGPVTFTVHVRNGTPYGYPGVSLVYDGQVWSSRTGTATAYSGLHIQQYTNGRWVDIQPEPAPYKGGFTAEFTPIGGSRLAPKATADYRLRIRADRTLGASATSIDGSFFAGGPGRTWNDQYGAEFIFARR